MEIRRITEADRPRIIPDDGGYKARQEPGRRATSTITRDAARGSESSGRAGGGADPEPPGMKPGLSEMQREALKGLQKYHGRRARSAQTNRGGELSAEFLESFLLAPPEYQHMMIEQQRELDRLRAETERLRERDERQRHELLMKHCPAWRRGMLRLSWAVYSWAMPRWAS